MLTLLVSGFGTLNSDAWLVLLPPKVGGLKSKLLYISFDPVLGLNSAELNIANPCGRPVSISFEPAFGLRDDEPINKLYLVAVVGRDKRSFDTISANALEFDSAFEETGFELDSLPK